MEKQPEIKKEKPSTAEEGEASESMVEEDATVETSAVSTTDQSSNLVTQDSKVFEDEDDVRYMGVLPIVASYSCCVT